MLPIYGILETSPGCELGPSQDSLHLFSLRNPCPYSSDIQGLENHSSICLYHVVSISGGRVNLVSIPSCSEAEISLVLFGSCHSSTNSARLCDSFNRSPSAKLNRVVSVACKQDLSRYNISAVSD